MGADLFALVIVTLRKDSAFTFTLNCELVSSVHRDGSEEEEEEEEESPTLKLAGDTLARVPRVIDRRHFLLDWITLCISDCRCRSES